MRYVLLLGVPLSFYVLGGFGKRIVRGGRVFWDRRDWFLGADASLANLAAGLIYLSELLFELDERGSSPSLDKHLLSDALFLAGTVIVYVVILAIHTTYEDASVGSGQQLTWLVGVCNVIAIATMGVFIVLVKGL